MTIIAQKGTLKCKFYLFNKSEQEALKHAREAILKMVRERSKDKDKQLIGWKFKVESK